MGVWAGVDEVLVTGMGTRWTRARPGADGEAGAAAGSCLSVALRTTMREAWR